MKQSGVSLLHSCSPSIGRPHRLTPIFGSRSMSRADRASPISFRSGLAEMILHLKPKFCRSTLWKFSKGSKRSGPALRPEDVRRRPDIYGRWVQVGVKDVLSEEMYNVEILCKNVQNKQAEQALWTKKLMFFMLFCSIQHIILHHPTI